MCFITTTTAERKRFVKPLPETFSVWKVMIVMWNVNKGEKQLTSQMRPNCIWTPGEKVRETTTQMQTHRHWYGKSIKERHAAKGLYAYLTKPRLGTRCFHSSPNMTAKVIVRFDAWWEDLHYLQRESSIIDLRRAALFSHLTLSEKEYTKALRALRR